MRTTNKQSGYILIVTLMVISLSVVLVSYLFTRSSVYLPLSTTVIKREQAKMLALGGIQVAMSQVAVKKSAVAKANGKDAGAREKRFLAQLLPVLNRWQGFKLTEKEEGLDAQLGVCLMCEDGKININEMYDFDTHTFLNEGKAKGDYKKMMQELFGRIEKMVQGKDLYKAFEKFLKARQYKLNDVTELLTSKPFEIFKNNVFYEPPAQAAPAQAAPSQDAPAQNEIQKSKERPLYLTDIFTVWSGVPTVEPWVLSDSVRGVLGLTRVEYEKKESRKKEMSQLLKKFTVSTRWDTQWNALLQPLYGKDFAALPKGIAPLLSAKFEPMIFSVLSYGKVGDITQKVYALIERIPSSKDDDFLFGVTVKRIYWM